MVGTLVVITGIEDSSAIELLNVGFGIKETDASDGDGWKDCNKVVLKEAFVALDLGEKLELTICIFGVDCTGWWDNSRAESVVWIADDVLNDNGEGVIFGEDAVCELG